MSRPVQQARAAMPNTCLWYVGPDLGRRPGHTELLVDRPPLPRAETSTRSSPLTTGLGVWTKTPDRLLYPGTISTAARSVCQCPTQTIRASKFRTRYPGNIGTNCQNCYAIPGHRFRWHAGATGVGPLLPRQRADSELGNLSDPSLRHQRHAQTSSPIRHRRLQRRHTSTRAAPSLSIRG